jgi:hypothetical protein
MTLNWAVGILLLGFGALGLYFRIYIKSTVSESIKNQFEIEHQKMREEFEREIHAIDRRDKFKLAALDKRLEAHQRAYTLAIKMNQTLGQPNEGREVEQKCKTFWEEQNIFLSNDIRKKFQEPLFFYQEYHYRVQNADEHEQKVRDGLLNKIESSEDKLRNLPFIIEQAVNLEPIEIKEQL